MQFDGSNWKQSFTVTQQGVSLTTDQLVSCACDEAKQTAHMSAQGQSQCATTSQDVKCSDISFWGDTSNAQLSLAVDCPDECGAGSGDCDRWALVSVPPTFMAAVNKLGSGLAEVNQNPILRMQGVVETSMDVYFKKNSSMLVGIMADSTEQQQLTMCFKSWDTNSSIDPATWSVPDDWGECKSVTPPPSESLQVGVSV